MHVLEKRGDRWQVVSNAGHPLDERTALLYLERDWNQAEMKQDAAWFERTLTDEFTGVDSRTGKPTNKAQVIADIKNRRPPPPTSPGWTCGCRATPRWSRA